MYAHECPVLEVYTYWLHWWFYCSDLILWFHCRISDQKDPLVYLVIGFSWRPWRNLDPFWYQALSNVRGWSFWRRLKQCPIECNILWECINFREETGVKLIYWLIDHNLSLSIIIHLPSCRDLIFQCCGISPSQICTLLGCFNYFKY